MNTPTAIRPIPPRVIRARRLGLQYEGGDERRHFMRDDIAMSHIVSMLSSVFPEGEDFFVRTVRNYREAVTDPELKRQVSGFIGQEAMHGREHRAFNERLATLGYPTKLVDRVTGIGLRLGERVLPRSVQLAITAALEHYTATLAEVLLSDEEARDLFDVGEIRSLLLWHALEESEHKSVAFDVYQSVSGNHWIRVGVMNATTVGFLGGIALASVVSVLTDSAARRPARVWRSVRGLRTSPWIRPEVRRRIRAYNRRDFHPDDFDNVELTREWRERLFGPAGTLRDRVEQARVADQST